MTRRHVYQIGRIKACVIPDLPRGVWYVLEEWWEMDLSENSQPREQMHGPFETLEAAQSYRDKISPRSYQ